MQTDTSQSFAATTQYLTVFFKEDAEARIAL
jgi:hypothetical protein